MKSTLHTPHRASWWIAAAIVVAIAVVSLLDLGNTPYSGFTAAAGTTISQVSDDGPAQAAGLEVGDKILVNAGINTEDLHALFRQPRAKVGETRQFVVEREGENEPLEVAMTYSELPGKFKGLFLAAAFVGLTFLGAGVGAYFRDPSFRSRLLALLGVAAMTVFVSPPYLSDANLRLAYGLIPLVGTALMPALMLHFLLCYPQRRRFLDRGIALWLIYGPVAVLGLLGVATFFIRPQLLGIAIFVAAAIPVSQLLVAIGVLITCYVKASPANRATHALGVLLMGFLGGLLPAIVAGFVPSLPGGQFYFLTAILVPLSLAYTSFKGDEQQAAGLQPQLS